MHYMSGKKKVRVSILQMSMAILFALIIAACSSKSPSPGEGEIKINLVADSDINPNDRGQPAPLNIFVYSIKSVDAFENGDFFEITEGNSKEIQAVTSKIYEAILQPDESRSVILKMNSDTQALGFIGAYRDIRNTVWIATWRLPEKKKRWWDKVNIFSTHSIELTAHFQKAAIIINKMD